MKPMIALLLLLSIDFGLCKLAISRKSAASRPERKLFFVTENEQDQEIAKLNNVCELKSDWRNGEYSQKQVGEL